MSRRNLQVEAWLKHIFIDVFNIVLNDSFILLVYLSKVTFLQDINTHDSASGQSNCCNINRERIDAELYRSRRSFSWSYTHGVKDLPNLILTPKRSPDYVHC